MDHFRSSPARHPFRPAVAGGGFLDDGDDDNDDEDGIVGVRRTRRNDVCGGHKGSNPLHKAQEFVTSATNNVLPPHVVAPVN